MTKEIETARNLEAMQIQKSEIYYTATKELTKKQKEQAEREKSIEEIRHALTFHTTNPMTTPIIYAITFKNYSDINGNRRHRAKYWILWNGAQWDITKQVSLLNHGRYNGESAIIGGYAAESIAHISGLLFNDKDKIEYRQLNP